MYRTQKRQPHKLTLSSITPPVVLKFWTAQSLDLARQAAEAERAGNTERSTYLWGLAGTAAPADAFTKSYCAEHAKVAA